MAGSSPSLSNLNNLLCLPPIIIRLFATHHNDCEENPILAGLKLIKDDDVSELLVPMSRIEVAAAYE